MLQGMEILDRMEVERAKLMVIAAADRPSLTDLSRAYFVFLTSPPAADVREGYQHHVHAPLCQDGSGLLA